MKSFSNFKSIDEQINEVLSKDATAGDWISDFIKSDNPKFAGKSAAKRKEMALAAYYAKQRDEAVIQPNGTDKIQPDEGMRLCQVCGSVDCKEHAYKSPAVTGYVKEESGEHHDHAHVMKTMKNVDYDTYLKHMTKHDVDHSTENKHGVDTQHSGSFTGKIHGAEVSHKITKSGKREYYIKEETLDEISKETIKSYIGKAVKDVAEKKRQQQIALNRSKQPKLKDWTKQSNINQSIRIGDEAKKRASNIGKAAMKYAESVEQIDEISKETLGNYVHKAFARGNEIHKQVDDVQSPEERAKLKAELSKRNQGVIKAAQKMRKEDLEEQAPVAGTLNRHTVVVHVSDPDSPEEGKQKKAVSVLALHSKSAEASARKHFEKKGWKVHSAAIKEEVDLEEAVDTVKKDASGKVIAWSHEGDWEKNSTKKQGTGKAANLAGKALQKTKELNKEEVDLDEALKGPYHISVENGVFKQAHGKNYLHDKDQKSYGSGDKLTNEPRIATFDKETHAQKAAKQHGGTVTKMSLGTYRVVKEEVDLDEDAVSDYRDKKRSEREAEHAKQDPKHSVRYAKNMVDVDKAAKKAKERGIKVDPMDFNWKVRNGVQRGKLPEEVELEESWEVYDTKTRAIHSSHPTQRKALNAMNKLNDKHPGYETPGNLIASKFGARVSKLKEETLDEVTLQAHKVGVTVSDPNHTSVSQRKEKVQKSVIVKATDKGEAQAKAEAFYKKKGYKVHDSFHHSVVPATSMKTEEVQIDEAAWGKDKATNLRQAHDRHMEKALAANKAGDDEAVKTHQRKMQMIQGKLQKLKNNEEVELGEECEILSELDKKTLGNYVKKAHDQLMKHTSSVATKYARGDRDAMAYALDDTAVRKTANRTKGVDQAINKLTKEDTMVTYKEFMASIDEGRIDDLKDKLAADREKRLNKMDYSKEKEAAKNPVTKVKGHSYGAGDEEGEAETAKPAEPAEKRGRGRPAGSKSGATKYN